MQPKPSSMSGAKTLYLLTAVQFTNCVVRERNKVIFKEKLSSKQQPNSYLSPYWLRLFSLCNSVCLTSHTFLVQFHEVHSVRYVLNRVTRDFERRANSRNFSHFHADLFSGTWSFGDVLLLVLYSCPDLSGSRRFYHWGIHRGIFGLNARWIGGPQLHRWVPLSIYPI